MSEHIDDTLPAGASSWAQQVREEAAREAAATKKKARGRLSLRKNPAAANTLVILVLLAVAGLAHAPVFGDWHGYVATFGGIILGTLCALLARAWKAGSVFSGVLLFAAYIVFGGVLAVPQTSLYGVIPTVETLQTLVVGVVVSWKDLLTVQPPAGIFIGPAIVPYLTALLTSFIAVTIVTRTRRVLWAVMPVLVLLLTGILWGSQNSPWTPLLVPFATLLTLIWVSMVRRQKRERESHGTVAFSSGARMGYLQRWVSSLVILTVSVGAALAVNLFVSSTEHRTVLRDYIEPPLNLREYHSPVSMFRTWNTTDKDRKLLTVASLQPGDRVRLATLDFYDGTIFQVNGEQADAGFRHVGTVFSDQVIDATTPITELDVTILDYSSFWVPGIAHTLSLEFFGDNAAKLADSLYYSDGVLTGLTTMKLQPGDSYRLRNITQASWADDRLNGRAIASYPMPQDVNVPTAIAEKAAVLTAQAEPGLAQVRAIEQALNTQGFYSDGSDGLSLPGHRADRLEKFVSQPRMIGDDDQYAPTMALMLRSLGIPSRVVMGFYAESDTPGEVTFTGKDTHLWVEVPFEGVGWVPFDPTPPRDQVPQTETPKPRPNPTPQVLQPPEPPEEPAEAPLEIVEEPDDEQEETDSIWPLVVLIAQIVGVTLLVLSPWLLLLLLKLLRRRKRRKKGRTDMRVAGAWEELVDRATDYGVTVTNGVTRRDQARQMDASLEGREAPGPVGFRRVNEPGSYLENFAVMLDTAVFSEGMPDEEMCHTVWSSSKQAVHSMKKRVPWYRRVRSFFSTRSLRARRVPLHVRAGRVMARLKRQR